MNPFVVALVVLYSVAGILALYRVIVGPRVLDRIVASDVLLATLMCAIATEMAVNGHTDNLVILVVISLFGVVGSFSIARFMTGRDES